MPRFGVSKGRPARARSPLRKSLLCQGDPWRRWRELEVVELAEPDLLDRLDHRRLLGTIGDISSAETEANDDRLRCELANAACLTPTSPRRSRGGPGYRSIPRDSRCRPASLPASDMCPEIGGHQACARSARKNRRILMHFDVCRFNWRINAWIITCDWTSDELCISRFGSGTGHRM